MVKIFFLICIVCLSFLLVSQLNLFSAESFVLSGLGRPVNLNIDNNQLYILENHRIHIYSLKDFKHIKSFGKKGQGPGEFQTLPHVHITLDCSTEKLIIGSMRKVSYFSKNGTYLKEAKGKSRALRLVYIDEKNEQPRFLGWSQKVHNKFVYNTINVFDHQLNKVREIYETKDPYQGAGKGYDLLTNVFSYNAYKGRIIIPGKNNSSVDVLNYNLDFKLTINVKSKPLSVSKKFKKDMIHFLKTGPETKSVYPLIKPIRFPKYFPPVNTFFTDNNIIYIMSWEKTEKGNTFYLYDMDGNFIQKKIIPIKYETDIQTYPIAVKNNKLYQLVENDREDEWELVITDL